MSDNNIPFEIQMEIIQRIPDTKSLIRCRSVSKAWKSVIDSKDFVTAHTLHHSHDQAHRHLLIRNRDRSDGQVKYVSIVDDDDTFPNQKVSVFVPDSVNKFSHDSELLGSCHGLFCFYDDKTSTTVIWNPSIRKTVSIPVPNVLYGADYRTVVGFGVCPRNLDPKLVKITYLTPWNKLQDVNASTQVEVFNLSSGGTWRSPLCSKLPHKSIKFWYSQAVVDGVLYWDAFHRINVGDRYRNLIISFNLTTEEFTTVNLPAPLAFDPRAELSLSNLKESLAVIEFDMYTLRGFCEVWMMSGHGCTRSFNRLYSIAAPHSSILRTTLGFRKNGAPVIELQNNNDHCIPNALATYEPDLKNITDIGIHGSGGNFYGHSYRETLLLLGH